MFELEERLWWFRGMRAITASLLDAPGTRRIQQVLDAGCGTGYSMIWLRERFTAHVCGVDSSLHAAAFWPKRGLDTAALASVDKLPFSLGEFDLVTCFDVIYQLNDERASAAISEIHRVLAPGGLLFIREPAFQWMRGAHDKAVGTRRRYTRKDLRRLLLAHGFKVKRSTYANTVLFCVAAPYRLLTRLMRSRQSDVKPVPDWINKILGAVLELEARALRRITFPFGMSIVALAVKK